MKRQALTLPSPLKSTGILSNARDTTITGSTFTDIGGNQYVVPGFPPVRMMLTTSYVDFPRPCNRRYSRPQQRWAGVNRENRWSWLLRRALIVAGISISADMKQYRDIKYYGDLRAIGVPSRRYRSIRPGDRRERDVVEECTVSYQNQIVTARTYRGKSAWKVSTVASLALIPLLIVVVFQGRCWGDFGI